MSAQPQRHPFSVADYVRMTEAGILAEDDRVELIEGDVVHMPPVGSQHAAPVKRLNLFLGRRVGDRALLSVQDPIRLDDFSEPEPDIALLRPRDDFYAAAHPGANDVLLLIEVSDTSARFDRSVKLPLYASHGIREVWIVDVAGRAVEVCRDPRGRGYRDRSLLAGGEISPLAFPDLVLRVDAILG